MPIHHSGVEIAHSGRVLCRDKKNNGKISILLYFRSALSSYETSSLSLFDFRVNGFQNKEFFTRVKIMQTFLLHPIILTLSVPFSAFSPELCAVRNFLMTLY